MTLPVPEALTPEPSAEPASEPGHAVSYPRFLLRSLWLATEGPPLFYGWMFLLTAIALVGFGAWATQVRDGMTLTAMSDHVSWGLYIANFTFSVGLAAGGVMMLIPAYLYKQKEMKNLAIVGELLAVAAIIMCLLFVTVDLGRPDRFWHMMPGIGRFNWPISMLTWDVIVLNGYLLLNLHVCGYTLYTRFLGKTPNPKWYVPFVFLSIGWAISIHTVTAFLYCGLGGRPFWNTALLAPRFLASAFVSGPAFLIVSLLAAKRFAGLQGTEGPIKTLTGILKVVVPINILMVASEVFTEFYTGGSHTSSAIYLYFGLHGHNGLVPWIWTSIALTGLATFMLFLPQTRKNPRLLIGACVALFAAIWIEKGMGLIIPGFIPSTLHEVVEYAPSLTEWQVTAGIWAFGLMVFTVALKIALPILRGEETLAASASQAPDADGSSAD